MDVRKQNVKTGSVISLFPTGDYKMYFHVSVNNNEIAIITVVGSASANTENRMST